MLYRTAAFVVALLLGVAGLSSRATAEVGSCGSECSGPCKGFLIRSGTCQSSNGQCVCVPNTPAPGECAPACDGRPCVTHCPDGTMPSGFCTVLTVDTGCACSATCGTPPPTVGPAGLCCQTHAGEVPQCAILSPFSSQAYEFCLAIGVPYLNPPFGCNEETGMCAAMTPTSIVTPTPTPSPPPVPTPTPQCASEPCGGTCVLCPPCTPGMICPEAACLLGTCTELSGNCTCVTEVTPGPSATPTPPTTFTPVACLGDCDGDRAVTVDELVVAAGMLLGDLPLNACPEFVDHCTSQCGPGPVPPFPRLTVECLVRAVNNAVTGCPPARCSSDQDCDDGNPCTIDHCTPAGCVNECVCA